MINAEIRTICPEIYIVRFDETEYWSEDVVAACERVYGTYIVDVKEATHLCSFEASYCLYPVTNYPKKCPNHDEETNGGCWCDVVREATEWDVTYVDTYTVDHLIECGREGFDYEKVDISDWSEDEWKLQPDYDKMIENIGEGYRENSWEPWEGQE